MIRYKINPLQELKKRGYSTYALKTSGTFGGAELDRMRALTPPGVQTLNRLCELLKTQPGDVIEYVPDPEPGKA